MAGRYSGQTGSVENKGLVIGMAKVSIARCESYDTARVAEAVRKSVDLTGGIGSFVKTGMKVLLKPNMLSAYAG